MAVSRISPGDVYRVAVMSPLSPLSPISSAGRLDDVSSLRATTWELPRDVRDWIFTATGGRPADIETDHMRRQINVWFEGERILAIPYETIADRARIELPPIPDRFFRLGGFVPPPAGLAAASADILRGAAALPRPGAVPEPAPDVRKPLLGRVMRFRNRNENKESGK